jgi:hypothetical protein
MAETCEFIIEQNNSPAMKGFFSSPLIILLYIMSDNPLGSSGFSSQPTGRPATAAFAEESNVEDAAEKPIIPLLPEAKPNSGLRSITLGETIRFEEMGPVIINKDGTTRRIANWDQLTEQERQASWRRISKRNEERRKILLEQQEMEQDL